jgi:hypothetical protein
LLTITWRQSARFIQSQWESYWRTLQTALFDQLTKYLLRLGIRTALVWVRERVRGIGVHTHALVHLGPNPRALKAGLQAHLDRLFEFGPTGIHISMGEYGAKTVTMRAGALRYFCKGIDPAAFRYVGWSGETENIAAALGIRYQGPQGTIKIKRCGASQNIGPAARREAGWREIRDLFSLERLLNPPNNSDLN